MSHPIALVTGATSGIGLSAAGQLVAAGWDVWVAGRSLERAEQAAAETGGRALQLDVTDPASIVAALTRIEKSSGLDVLVNNAGIQPDYGRPLLELDVETLRAAYETNVFGVVAVTNALLPVLRRSTAPRIVNVSSGTASFGWSTGPNPQFDWAAVAGSGGSLAAYRSSKAALNALTLYYAQALAIDGFKVNALAPGARATSLNPSISGYGQDPAEAGRAIVTLAELPDDAPTGVLFSWDGTIAPW